MNESQPLVSVVTPFYNTAAYLAECIESVLGQTYENYEYLLCDNQSTDGSSEIAASYAARDPRIKLLRSPRFLTAESNYSFALEHIDPTSRYTKMVLADDWLYPNCITEMVRLASRYPTVHLVSSYGIWENYVGGGGLHASCEFLSGRETCRLHLFNKMFLFGTPSTVLYTSEIVRAHKPFFQDGHIHEDTEIAFRILQNHDFGFVHQVLSFTRVQEVSRQGLVRSYRPRQLDRLMIVKKYGRNFLNEQEYDKVEEAAVSGYYRGLATEWLLDRVRGYNAGFWEYQKKGLATIGEAIDEPRLRRYVAKVLLEGAFNWGRAAPYVWNKLMKRTRRAKQAPATPSSPVLAPSSPLASPSAPDHWPNFERIPESKRMPSTPGHEPPGAAK